MLTKTYVTIFTTSSMTLFLLVVGANFGIDPQGVFRAKHYDNYASTNERYIRFKAYQAAADSFDGLLFGSSRGRAFPPDELSRLSGGVRFARFAVHGGMIPDHLLVLEYVLREKAAKGLRLHTVLLWFDADLIGRRPLTNRFLQHTWPPEITGENTARFWWRNLTAIQYQAWKEKLWPHPAMAPAAAAAVAHDASLMNAASAWEGLLGLSVANAQPLNEQGSGQLKRVTEQWYYVEQLTMLQRIVALCRAQGVRLIVAASPLRSEPLQPDEAEVRRAIDKISKVTPLWDFTVPRWPSERADFWIDRTHFTPQLAAIMLRRIFGATPPDAADVIGVRRGE